MSKITIVRCKGGASVRLPDGVRKKIGDRMPCPAACSKRGRCFICTKKDGACSFSAASVLQFEESEAGRYLRYSADEERAAFGFAPSAELPPAVGAAAGPCAGAADAEQSNVSVRSEQAGAEQGNTSARTGLAGAGHGTLAGTDMPGTGAAASDAVSAAASDAAAGRRRTAEESCAKFNSRRVGVRGTTAENAVAQPSASHTGFGGADVPAGLNSFSVGGKVFSDDPTVRQKNRSARPLRFALWEVFNYWDTPSVFASPAKLRGEFLWLLSQIERKPDEKRVAAILESKDYSVSQKFFHLFYDAIYRYSPPKGFYWCDGRISTGPLSAMFSDREDFCRRYCASGQDGVLFRAGYRRCAKEVLHYLQYPSEERLFEDVSLLAAKHLKRIILLKKDKEDRYEPIDLGTCTEFVKAMSSRPDYARMQNMIAYLQRFRVLKGDVLVRAEPLEMSVCPQDLTEPDCVFQAAGLSASARYSTEFNAYMTLLHEYTSAFSPAEVTVGELKFTKAGFSGELRALVFEFCKLYFGQAEDRAVQRARGRALLARSIFKRKVLVGFLCEDEKELEKLLSLAAEPSCEQYFSLFRDPRLYIDGRDMSVQDYIAQLLQADACRAGGALQSDERVRAFYAFKLGDASVAAAEQNIRSAAAQYERQYSEFLQ